MNNEMENTYEKVVMIRSYVFARILFQPCYLMSSRAWEHRSIGANIGFDFGPLFGKVLGFWCCRSKMVITN